MKRQLPQPKKPLHEAATSGNLENLQALITQQTPVKDIDYALAYAAEAGHLETVKFLVEKGAYIHNTDRVREQGETPIIFASQNGHSEVVGYLIGEGTNVSTIIHFCSESILRDTLSALQSLKSQTAKDHFAIGNIHYALGQEDQGKVSHQLAIQMDNEYIVKLLASSMWNVPHARRTSPELKKLCDYGASTKALFSENQGLVKKFLSLNLESVFPKLSQGMINSNLVKFLVENINSYDLKTAITKNPREGFDLKNLIRIELGNKKLKDADLRIQNYEQEQKQQALSKAIPSKEIISLDRAAKGGNLEEVKLLLANGVPLNKNGCDYDSIKPYIMLASENNHYEVVKHLIWEGTTVKDIILQCSENSLKYSLDALEAVEYKTAKDHFAIGNIHYALGQQGQGKNSHKLAIQMDGEYIIKLLNSDMWLKAEARYQNYPKTMNRCNYGTSTKELFSENPDVIKDFLSCNLRFAFVTLSINNLSKSYVAQLLIQNAASDKLKDVISKNYTEGSYLKQEVDWYLANKPAETTSFKIDNTKYSNEKEVYQHTLANVNNAINQKSVLTPNLMTLVKSNNLQGCKKLFEPNPEVFKQEVGKPLLSAASSGYGPLCTWLIPNTSKDGLNAKDSEGKTALYWAASFRLSQACKELIPLVSDEVIHMNYPINSAKQYNTTNLQWIAKMGNIECLNLFISRVTKPELFNRLDSTQESALTWAAWKGHTEVCKILIPKMSQDIATSADQFGCTALNYAINQFPNNLDLAKTLIFSTSTKLIDNSLKANFGFNVAPIKKIVGDFINSSFQEKAYAEINNHLCVYKKLLDLGHEDLRDSNIDTYIGEHLSGLTGDIIPITEYA